MQQPTTIREAEHYRPIWLLHVAPGVTLKDVQMPSFWAHVARRLRPLAEIIVYAHDNSWRAQLLVRSASALEATVVVLQHHDLAALDKEASAAVGKRDDVEIKHRGFAKWSAVRKSDGAVLVEGLETKDAVVQWLKDPKPHKLAA